MPAKSVRDVGTRWVGKPRLALMVRQGVTRPEGGAIFDVGLADERGTYLGTLTEIGQSNASAWKRVPATDPDLLDEIARSAISFACDPVAGIELDEAAQDFVEQEAESWRDEAGTVLVRRSP